MSKIHSLQPDLEIQEKPDPKISARAAGGGQSGSTGLVFGWNAGRIVFDPRTDPVKIFSIFSAVGCGDPRDQKAGKRKGRTKGKGYHPAAQKRYQVIQKA